jgi:hypothetical protein
MLNLDEIVKLDCVIRPTLAEINSFKNYVFYGLGGFLMDRLDFFCDWLGKAPAAIIDRRHGGGEY